LKINFELDRIQGDTEENPQGNDFLWKRCKERVFEMTFLFSRIVQRPWYLS
jgi:hypothetical protein